MKIHTNTTQYAIHQMSLLTLPVEITEYLLAYLDPKWIHRVGRCCRRLNTIANRAIVDVMGCEISTTELKGRNVGIFSWGQRYYYYSNEENAVNAVYLLFQSDEESVFEMYKNEIDIETLRGRMHRRDRCHLISPTLFEELLRSRCMKDERRYHKYRIRYRNNAVRWFRIKENLISMTKCKYNELMKDIDTKDRECIERIMERIEDLNKIEYLFLLAAWIRNVSLEEMSKCCDAVEWLSIVVGYIND